MKKIIKINMKIEDIKKTRIKSLYISLYITDIYSNLLIIYSFIY